MSNRSKLEASVNVTMENVFFVEPFQQPMELDSVAVKATFVFVAFVSILSSATAIIVMHRSKKTPYASKIMSTGLLTFDVIFITTSTIRKFVSDPIINPCIQTVVILSLQLSVFTISLMSLDRYFAIVKPVWYITHMQKAFIWNTILFAWVLEASLCLAIRYGACYIQYQSMPVFTTTGFCSATMSKFYAVVLVFVLTTSCTCYWKIFQCISSKIRPCNTSILSLSATIGQAQNFRSTSLVLVYLMVIIASSVGYGIILLLISFGNVSLSCLRIALELVSFCNCLLDPFLYVVWFKECRLQLYKMLAFLCSRYEQRVELMRIRVYDIVISNSKETRRTNTSADGPML